MKRTLITSLLIVGALLTQVGAQGTPPPNISATINQVARENPELLQTNVVSTCYQFVVLVLNRVADPRWGFVGKVAGEGQYTPPDWVPFSAKGRDGKPYTVSGVSHDAIYFCANLERDTAGKVTGCRYSIDDWQVDTLARGNDSPTPIYDASGNRITAQAQYLVVPQEYYRAGNPWLLSTIEPGPPTGPPPSPPKPQYPGDQWGNLLGEVIFADYAEAGQPPNPGMGVWFWRTAWDAAAEGLTMPESIKKHRNEWRAILGLPPIPQ